ncbi:hypothetical protein P170DRAFT_436648 [Aspergillus steynii IBT 23096]|uniref:Uncharacterized protein n=1 Tax=Aspergillus steynii IBT 23096 TaxID=1392250 RepID=A0A2I2G7Y0_9EURO|nr:uncharacterized protein P170DRAFT_436648 [Aspergillus steynii IBT 23096]PLB48975.1 hypothetical protein P170DRAFT_436648 [Aspergillus steynii IBT 23096]
MTTRDPEAMPLPSFDILNRQWMLNRIAALCGAADVTDEQPEDEDFWYGDMSGLEGSHRQPTQRILSGAGAGHGRGYF